MAHLLIVSNVSNQKHLRHNIHIAHLFMSSAVIWNKLDGYGISAPGMATYSDIIDSITCQENCLAYVGCRSVYFGDGICTLYGMTRLEASKMYIWDTRSDGTYFDYFYDTEGLSINQNYKNHRS